jgi:ubiquinone/menaquinone biosynthesis C-methylase UbiE
LKTSHFKKQEKYFDDELSYFKDYEKSLNAWRYSYLKRIKEDFLDKNCKGKMILDIGTGSGYIAIEMARMCLNVIALDIIKSALKNIEQYKAKYKLKNLTTILSSADKLSLKSESIDYIVVNSVLEHLENENQAISEWKRVLKPKGKIFITVPLKFIYIWPFFWPINFIHDRRLGHLHRYSVGDLKRKFRLKVKKVYYTGHFLKVCWILISRVFMGGLKKSSDLDYLFEKIDQKFDRIPYGANNLIVVLQK